jgi:hypothetical protein
MRPQRWIGLFAFLFSLAVATHAQTQTKAVDLSGKWIMTLDMTMGVAEPKLTLKQESEKLTGTYAGRYGSFPLTGTVKARRVEFSFAMSAEGQPVLMAFKGEISADGETMKGEATLGELGEAEWSAKRDKEQ